MYLRAHNAGGGDDGTFCWRDERTYTGEGGDGRYGPPDQPQRTVQESRLYLVIVGETIGGKVDIAETGGGY